MSEQVKNLLLKPFYTATDKKPRYYQEIAINRAIQAILEGRTRLLLTLATGTGKTAVAFQIIYKLWNNRWNNTGEYRRPKVLFLADRTVLVDDPHSKDFAVFGDARSLISEQGAVTSREIYFSTYQSLAEDSSREGLFRQFSRNFFDLIVVDECHRGSASDESNWRVILEHFTGAVQLGLTATPQRDDNKDTYAYFGNPLYVYSLRQGIEDGFLAPYSVRRVVADVDATGWRPQNGQTDAHGNLIPDEEYHTPDFERVISLLPRTKAVAQHLTNYLKANGRLNKTIVFCHDQEHADQMRKELNNLNADLTKQNPNYVVRITASDGEIGKGFLSRFMDVDQDFPVIVNTSKLLSTGVDIPTCKNVVIFRTVNAMTEFKQIIGRGTRVRADKDKLFFTILDYTGSATSKFADPEFDGIPPLITNEEINENGETVEGSLTHETPPEAVPEWTEEDIEEFLNPTDTQSRTKYYIAEGKVDIVNESVHITDAQGKLRTIEFTQHAKGQISLLCPNADELKAHWQKPEQRQKIIAELESRGIGLDALTDITKLKEADGFDMLCYVAFNLPPMTRRQRAEKVRKAKQLQVYSEKARDIINQILDKYVEYGLEQLTPGVLQVKPIADKGNLMELVKIFGDATQFKNTLTDIQTLLYDEAA